jgi:6,7-dimethyl-8-ribityllumazine synthase
MKKILIINANYYKNISHGLVESAKKKILNKYKIKIINVPGVFEIPVTISKNLKKYDAFIALGCVIKGQTPHFDFISQASTNAIMDLSIQSKKPIGNGIITCLNKKQALARKKKVPKLQMLLFQFCYKNENLI